MSKSRNCLHVYCPACRWSGQRVWREAEGFGACRCGHPLRKRPTPYSRIRQQKINEDFARTGR